MFKNNLTIRLKIALAQCAINRGRFFALGILSIFMVCFSGCQSIPTLPPANLSEPGWITRQGQVVWRAKKDSPEIAGELILAVHPDGRSFVQFTKTPLPFIVAQTTSNSWQIHIVPNDKTYSAHGAPPARLVWLHLAPCLANVPPPKNWSWERLENNGFRLQNSSTGEFLEGYLTP